MFPHVGQVRTEAHAFVEFEKSADLTEAYKDADGRKINGRRILVDVERGRTVKGWLPRRLGGGLGSTRAIGALLSSCSKRESRLFLFFKRRR